MAAEHEALMQLIRRLSGQDQTEPERLNGLFSDPTFLREIFRDFPLKRGDDPTVWTKFLKDTASVPAAERSLRYLGLRYGVSWHTIHHTIWDKLDSPQITTPLWPEILPTPPNPA
jgi:hypothetical protein